MSLKEGRSLIRFCSRATGASVVDTFIGKQYSRRKNKAPAASRG